MDSNQVAQLIAEQNQFFMSQNAMASQIGIAPLYQGGLAGYSMGGPAMPVIAPAPGQAAAPPPIHYGHSILGGYGAGNRVGAAAFGGMAGASVFGGAAFGAALMSRRLAPIAPLFDPFSAFGVARSMGMGYGTSLGAGGLAMVPGMAASHVIGSFIQGGQQQSLMNTALSQYQHINPASRTGFGFTRPDAQAIGDGIRNLAYIPEMYTSVAELTKLMPKLKEAGLMQGVKDASEFSRRFKEAVTTIRDVSRILGTTMEEASEFFSHSRRVGFFGKTEQLRNALNVQFTSAVTGMNSQQVMQVQQAGADLATAIGARRGLGARATTSMADSLGLLQQSGVMPTGLIEDVTGKQGTAAVQDAAVRMANLGVRLAHTPAGQATIAGFMKYENGRATGLDQGLVDRFMRGEIGLGEIKGRAGRLSHAEKVSFMNRRDDLAMSFAGQAGPGGIAKLLGSLGGEFKDPEAVGLIMKQYGATTGEADIAIEMARAAKTGQLDLQQALGSIRSREMTIREQYDPKLVMKRLRTRVGNAITRPFEQAGSEMLTSVTKAFDDFVDDMVGRHVVKLSEARAQQFRLAFSTGNKDQLNELFGKSTGLDKQYFSSGGGNVAGLIAGSLNVLTFGAMNLKGPGSGNLSGRDFFAQELDRKLQGLTIADTLVGEFTNRTESWSGRSSRTQFERARDALGIRGGLDEGTQKKVFETLGKLQAGNYDGILASDVVPSKEFQGGVGVVRKVMEALSGNEDYMRGDSEKRYSMLKAVLGDISRLSDVGLDAHTRTKTEGITIRTKTGASDITAYRDALKRLAGQGIDPAMALIAEASRGGTVGGIEMTGLASAGINMSMDVKDRAIKFREISDELRGKVGAETMAFIENKPELMGIVKKALAGGANNEFEKLIEGGNTATVAAEMRKRGIKVNGRDVDENDVQEMRTALRTFKRQGETAGNALKNYEAIDIARSMTAMQLSLGNLSGELQTSASKLKGSLADKVSNLQKRADAAAASIGSGNAPEMFEALREGFRGLFDEYQNPEKRKALSAALPESVRVALQVATGFKQSVMELKDTDKSGLITVDEAASQLRLDGTRKKELEDLFKDGVKKITPELAKEIQVRTGVDAMAQMLASKPQSGNAQEQKDKAIVDQLKLMTQAIIAVAKKDEATMNQIYGAVRGMTENGGASPAGDAVPGSISWWLGRR